MEETENKIQQDVVVWFNNNYCLKHNNPRWLIASIPNGGKRDVREAIMFKNTGVLKGFSDLIIVGHGTVLFIEVKTPTGRQSDSQIDFEVRVQRLGFEYWVVRSLEEFKKLFENYLQLSK